MNKVIRLQKIFQQVLLDESQHRNSRSTFIEGEIEWIVKEREAMFKTLLAERAKLGKGPVPLAALMQVERLATGHVDYADKFALGCAELVLGE